MGRRKAAFIKIIIGLDMVHANTLNTLSDELGLTYSEVISYLIDCYRKTNISHGT